MEELLGIIQMTTFMTSEVSKSQVIVMCPAVLIYSIRGTLTKGSGITDNALKYRNIALPCTLL